MKNSFLLHFLDLAFLFATFSGSDVNANAVGVSGFVASSCLSDCTACAIKFRSYFDEDHCIRTCALTQNLHVPEATACHNKVTKRGHRYIRLEKDKIV